MSFTRVNPSNWPHGGDVTSDEMNQLDIDHANAVDKTGDTITGPQVLQATSLTVDDTSSIINHGDISIASDGTFETVAGADVSFGGNVVFSANVEIDGIPTLTGGHNMAINSRTVTRVQSGSVLALNWDATNAPIFSPDATAQAGVIPMQIELKIPHGATLTSVTARISGSGHSSLPVVMPQLKIQSVDGSGTVATLGSVATDGSASTGVYDSPHDLTVSGLSVVIDRTTKRYVALLLPESSTHAVIGSPLFYQLKATWTQTAYEED